MTLKELYSDTIKITDSLEIVKLKVEDVVKYGEEVYMLFLSMFCSKPFDLILFLDEQGIREDEISHYQVFQILFDKYWAIPELQSLTCHFLGVKELKKLQVKDTVAYADPTNASLVLTEEVFGVVSKIVSDMSKYSNKKVEKFANEFTREMYIENLLEELEDKKEESFQSSYSNFISAIVLRTSYSYDTALKLTMDKFHSLITMIRKRDEFIGLMNGVYSGNIDTKKMRIDEYNWLVDNNKEE